MNLSLIVAVVALLLSFGGFYAINYDFANGGAYEDAWDFVPPYYFIPGELVSSLNSFFFVFAFSLLFFGYSAPVALAIEGAKYGSLAVHGKLVALDLAFLFPEILAAYSAILLGQGVLSDFEGKDTVFVQWGSAIRFFALGFGLALGLYFARRFLVP